MARFLAIDWNPGGLHVVLADLRGGAAHVRRAFLSAEAEVPTPENAAALGKLLAERLAAAGIGAAPVLACVGRDRFLVKEVRFPRVPDTEEPAVVRFQTVKELTDPPDEVVIDYLTIPGPAEGEQKAVALVVRREVVAAYRTLCESAGLKFQALTPRLLGTAACLRHVMGKAAVTPPEPSEGAVAVVLLGEKLAELGVFQGTVPLLSRSLPQASPLAAEVRRNLAVHAGQFPQHPIGAIYLAGKGAAELRERLVDLIEVPVHTFDPFAGSEASELPTGNRGTFAGAVGLLQMRAAGELPVNFISPRQPRPPADPNRRLLRLGAVAAVALIVGLAVLGRVLQASWSRELEGVRIQREAVDKDLLAATDSAKRLKVMDDWDTVVWEDELYDLTARIGDVDALRIVSLTAEGLAANPKTRAAAKLTIRGVLLDRDNPRRPLDRLVARFREDGYYSPEAPRVENDKFSLIVYVERRGPANYRRRIAESERKKQEKATRDTRRGDQS